MAPLDVSLHVVSLITKKINSTSGNTLQSGEGKMVRDHPAVFSTIRSFLFIVVKTDEARKNECFVQGFSCGRRRGGGGVVQLSSCEEKSVWEKLKYASLFFFCLSMCLLHNML